MTEENEGTDEDGQIVWPTAFFAKQMQEAGEQALEQQADVMKQMFGGGGFGRLSSQLNAMSTGMATFKARVQSGGRISIPDTEREALGIDEGDVVQTFVIPVKKENKGD